MRIIAGSLKGRRLDAPSWNGLRPTSDKLRETLFNVLAPRMEGARVLDGYAGTGAVGIEALSRGASHVTFVERDPRAVRLIETNLDRCGIGRSSHPRLRGTVRHFGSAAPAATPRNDSTPGAAEGGDRYAIIRAGFAGAGTRLPGARFDIIFLDPPYGPDDLTEALEAAAPLVAEGGLLVIEHAKRDRPPDAIGGLERRRELVSGDSALAFYVHD
jgi:16S rRNA (guanine966-N2)-methyltransferase